MHKNKMFLQTPHVFVLYNADYREIVTFKEYRPFCILKFSSYVFFGSLDFTSKHVPEYLLYVDIIKYGPNTYLNLCIRMFI